MAALSNSKTVTHEEWPCIPEVGNAIGMIFQGILAPKRFPHVHISIQENWPD